MQRTTKNERVQLSEKMTLDTSELMQVLSCGRETALKIGEAAEARIQVGKRILWNCNKIKIYLDAISTE